MSFALLVPADDSEPIVLRGMSEGATISAQARELLDGLWEVVRARGLHQLAPELSAVMLVDGVPAHRPFVVDEVLLVLPGGLNQVFEVSPKPCVALALRDGIGEEFQPRHDVAALGSFSTVWKQVIVLDLVGQRDQTFAQVRPYGLEVLGFLGAR